jgi:triosephosphate isomerase
MNKKLIIANWKMNPGSVKDAKKIITEINKKSKSFGDVCLVVCPPFIFLNEVSQVISSSKRIILGAQDVFVGQGVSHTGEIGIQLLKKSGVKYVLVGHSERRATLDSDEIVKEKMLGSLREGLIVVLCVGEKERNEHGDHYQEVKKQITDIITKLPKKLIKNLIIAYEPIWAIGRPENEAIKPDQLHEITIFIKRLISDILGPKEMDKIKILYGGSVTKNNAREIIEMGNVDGLLIGRESLKVDNFLELIKEFK